MSYSLPTWYNTKTLHLTYYFQIKHTKNIIFKWIFINLHQTPMIFMHMALSILCFKLACANKTDLNSCLMSLGIIFGCSHRCLIRKISPPPLLNLESFDRKQWSLGDDLELIPKYYIYLFNLVRYDLDQYTWPQQRKSFLPGSKVYLQYS